MRKAMLTALAACAVAAIFVPGPVESQDRQYFCVPGRGCVPVTQARHAACFDLALQRGLNVSRGDSYNLQLFIYQCLAGQIPR
jgi:hypothetical protein